MLPITFLGEAIQVAMECSYSVLRISDAPALEILPSATSILTLKHKLNHPLESLEIHNVDRLIFPKDPDTFQEWMGCCNQIKLTSIHNTVFSDAAMKLKRVKRVNPAEGVDQMKFSHEGHEIVARVSCCNGFMLRKNVYNFTDDFHDTLVRECEENCFGSNVVCAEKATGGKFEWKCTIKQEVRVNQSLLVSSETNLQKYNALSLGLCAGKT